MPRCAPNRMPSAVKRRYFELTRMMSFSAVRAGPRVTDHVLSELTTTMHAYFSCDRLLERTWCFD
jgi:hypothetical protein